MKTYTTACLRLMSALATLMLAAPLALGSEAHGALRWDLGLVGGIPISLGAPAGVMLAGIAISTLRSRYPLFGGPVSEGARSLLQDLGLDLFIAAVAINTAPNVVAAFSEGGVVQILSIGMVAALLPPLLAWFVGWKLLKLNPAVLVLVAGYLALFL